jgi:Kdo2-lipid IVA lauroyltransferase/acyltransferase
VLKLFSRLPLSGLYVFSDFLFVVVYHVIGYRKKLVWKNLKNSFPDKSDKELKSINKQFYKNLCDYAVETIKLVTISQEELSKRMIFKNPEILQPFANQKQSVIILASHLFNWEWLLTVGSFKLPMKVDFVYQEQRSKYFNDFSLKTRTRFGAYPIKREAVGRESLRRKDELRAIAIVTDQFPGQGQNKRYWTNFLHQNTAFFLGIGQLAVLLQYPVFFFKVKKIKRGYYEAEGIWISNPPYAKESNSMVDTYAQVLEKSIHEYPDGWLWSHNRWKNVE